MNRFEDGEKNGESVLDFFFISPSPSLLLQHVYRRKRRMRRRRVLLFEQLQELDQGIVGSDFI